MVGRDSEVFPAHDSGTAVALQQRMLTHGSSDAPRRPVEIGAVCIIRWVFHRGAETLTCAIEPAGDGRSFDVCVLPHWNMAAAAAERFDAASGAFRRHAEIALQLREAGWVVHYSAGHSAHVAA
jgi:hypothetical protein